jgi:hypothetical protein
MFFNQSVRRYFTFIKKPCFSKKPKEARAPSVRQGKANKHKHARMLINVKIFLFVNRASIVEPSLDPTLKLKRQA